MEGQSKILKVLVVVIVVIVINVISIDVWLINTLFYKNIAGQKVSDNKASTQDEKNGAAIQANNPVATTCPSSCMEKIYEATSSLKLEKQFVAPVAQTSQSISAVKEFIITFGSGVNTSDDWIDIRGASAYVDSTKYNSVKQITFEASVFIPNGNQFTNVRLYNVTDKLVVWKSEMTHEGGEAKLLVSPPIALATGNKLYQVQMKSQLKGPTNLDQARLRIITH